MEANAKVDCVGQRCMRMSASAARMCHTAEITANPTPVRKHNGKGYWRCHLVLFL